MSAPLEHTIRYKTYLKQTVAEALQAVFEDHPDSLLRDTKVRIPDSFEEADYPLIVVRYHERSVRDAGVGHYERGYDEATNRYYKRQRKHYRGSLEFEISALSSLDLDLISDAFIETVMMSEILSYTNYFLARIYAPEEFERLKDMPTGSIGTYHYYNLPNLGTQDLSAGGESAVPAPWGPEDVLVYQTSYTMEIFGEVISLPPDILYNLITDIRPYPYVGGAEPVPTGADDPAPWLPEI